MTKAEHVLDCGSLHCPPLLNYIVMASVVSAAAHSLMQIPPIMQRLYGIDADTQLMLIGQSYIDVQDRVREMMKGG